MCSTSSHRGEHYVPYHFYYLFRGVFTQTPNRQPLSHSYHKFISHFMIRLRTDFLSNEWNVHNKMPQGSLGNCLSLSLAGLLTDLSSATDTVQMLCSTAHLMIRLISSDIILWYLSMCTAWPVCVLEHDTMGLYLWSYCSDAPVNAAFDLRTDNNKRKPVSAVGPRGGPP